jgi:chromosome segregation ATPase
MASTPTSPSKRGTAAKRFPLVHKLVQFADLRRYYAEMREALKDSNRSAGAYKAWVTRWKNKAEGLELQLRQLDVEVATHVHEKKVLSEQLRSITEDYQAMGTVLAKLEHFESAIDELRRLKLVADEQSLSAGYWSANAQNDLRTGVDDFLEAVDEIMDDEWVAPEKPSEAS